LARLDLLPTDQLTAELATALVASYRLRIDQRARRGWLADPAGSLRSVGRP